MIRPPRDQEGGTWASHETVLSRSPLCRTRFRQQLSANVARRRNLLVELPVCHASRLSAFAIWFEA